jgi:peptide/nickel transport system ATP-binding protein
VTDRLLEVDGLSVHFRTPTGVVKAVDDVSLRLDAGRTIALVGESGCGKSAFSRAVLGLTPRDAVARYDGSVRLSGQELMGRPERELRELRGREMAMVFQDPMTALNPVMTIGRQIGESLRAHLGLRRAAARRRAVELLAQVGIPSPARRVDDHPHQLSGGMRQRVMIAIALSCEPRLLVADEPTTALDVTVQSQIMELLGRLQAERRMGVVFVTHDLGLAAGFADEVAVMYAGKLVERATPVAAFHYPRMPYTDALLGSIPRLADAPHTRLRVIAGRPPTLEDPWQACAFAPRCGHATDRCDVTAPPLAAAADDPDRAFRCWNPLGAADGHGDRRHVVRPLTNGVPGAG